MRRREFISLLGGAATWPVVASAQQQPLPVIGFLRSGDAGGAGHLLGAFRRGLNEAGLFEGRNVSVEYQFADEQHERLPALVADSVRRQERRGQDAHCLRGGLGPRQDRPRREP